jgi:hypothetical protein
MVEGFLHVWDLRVVRCTEAGNEGLAYLRQQGAPTTAHAHSCFCSVGSGPVLLRAADGVQL